MMATRSPTLNIGRLGCGFYHHRLNLGSGIGPEAGGFIGMPVMNGIQAAYEIRRISPSTKILFFTIHKNEALSGIRLRGAEAFVTKSAAGTELLPALKRMVKPKTERHFPERERIA